MTKTKNKRRNFIRETLLAGAGLFSTAVTAATVAPDTPEDEVVKLLTSDGNLVEVKKSILAASKGISMSNKGILEWIAQEKGKNISPPLM